MKQGDRPLAEQIVRNLLAIAKLSTMRSKYEQLEPGSDGRIRTVLSVVGTETGRLSSSGSFLEASTNLQNQPKKVAMLDPLYNTRRCVVPSRGCVLVEADLKQAEAFATAAFSADDALLARMQSGEDIHAFTAGHIFGKQPAQVTKRERHLGKVARHAFNYGMGWKTFLTDVNKEADLTGIAITAAEAKRISSAYHRLHPALKRWWREIKQQIAQKGYLRNPFGRRRDFFGRPSSHETEKEAIAFLPQSTIADHLNSRLIALFEQEAGFRLLLQIHDAVLLEVSPRELVPTIALVRETLEHEIEINGRSVLIPVEIGVGENWAELEEVA